MIVCHIMLYLILMLYGIILIACIIRMGDGLFGMIGDYIRIIKSKIRKSRGN